MAEPFFNYIITIHNKQDLIRDVLVSVLLCSGRNSKVYAVLDGCTDDTEAILDKFTEQYQGVPLIKVYAPDVHEILSINTGLKAASQDGEGYNIILQDDVILADLDFESKVKQLYAWGGGTLGLVSFRMGANLAADALTSTSDSPMTDLIENAYGHGLPHAAVLLPGRFAYRTVPIKSPICIPTKVVREVGLLNENLAPYMHDDTELAIRTTLAGYVNGVFALRYFSDVRWGGTRTNPHPELNRMSARNMNRIRAQFGQQMEGIARGAQRCEVVSFPGLCSEKLDNQALSLHEKTTELLLEMRPSLLARIRNRLRLLLSDFLKRKQAPSRA